jgi:acyl-coenzyme A thioesterase PaaI-like protein
MPESVATRLYRWGFNLFPAYRGTVARITFIAADWREVRIKLPLNWRTKNYVGTISGGSMYGAADPFYMVMLIKILGPEYIVWDKAASIRCKKPGTHMLYAAFTISNDEVAAIRTALVSAPSVERHYRIELVDAERVVYAAIDKTVYIRRRDTNAIGR